MKPFEYPEIEIVKLEVEDVINSSLVLDNMGEWDGLE
jgi:hypothetical protein